MKRRKGLARYWLSVKIMTDDSHLTTKHSSSSVRYPKPFALERPEGSSSIGLPSLLCRRDFNVLGERVSFLSHTKGSWCVHEKMEPPKTMKPVNQDFITVPSGIDRGSKSAVSIFVLAILWLEKA